MSGGEHLDLRGFVPPIVHPMKIAILGALAESDQPRTVGELAAQLEEAAGISLVAYHVRTLVQQGAVEEVHGDGVKAALTRYRFRPNRQARQ